MRQFAVLLLTVIGALAQTEAPKAFVGTVTGFRPESAEVEIRPDQGEPVMGKLAADTIAQKIAPGARDLKNAESIKLTDLAAGDRVLITIEPGSREVRRIVVMPAAEIARSNEADRLDWQKRGVAGLVATKSGNRITVKTRAMAGEVEYLITVDERTSFKRYAPDSVKFSDAVLSKLSEVTVGDQLRARGEKSADGLHIKADEVVFGTFLVKAGTITAVNRESQLITVKELGTNKPLTVVLGAGSQIKQMPDFSAGASGPMGRGGIAPGAAPGGRGGMMGGPPSGLDINQMLERMPPSKLEDLKSGSTVIISSTKGVNSDQLTAIMLLSNADMLIQMASIMSGRGRGRGDMGPGMGAPGMGGMQGGDLGGLGLSGIIMQ